MTASTQLRTRIDEVRERFFADPPHVRPQEELPGILDQTVRSAWASTPEEAGFSVLAIGGYGRRTLHPYSDLDLLFLFDGPAVAEKANRLLLPLWDLNFRVGQQVRQVSDFDEFRLEEMESYTSFLDARPLYGDPALAARFIGTILPGLVARHRKRFLRALVAMKASRHRKFGGTPYHLEPDLKRAPGGLRDYQWVQWVRRVLGAEPDPALDRAVEPLHRIRNGLHFLARRDQNILTFAFQEPVAAALGFRDTPGGEGAEILMREYFLAAERIVLRAAVAEASITARPAAWSLPAPPPDDAASILKLFAEAHRRKLPLSWETLDEIRRRVVRLPPEALATREHGRAVLELMKDRPGIYATLAAMHQVGLLGGIFPEFERIRCRVIRDYFHRYTVDQHSLLAIRHIEELRPDETLNARRGLVTVLHELAAPELLLLALLLHDAGKAAHDPAEGHVGLSVQAADAALARLELPERASSLVRNVIGNHLKMSRVMALRDLADEEVIAGFAREVGTEEDLRMLCLATYADMKAVAPEVWTEWKEDLLWQLYVSAYQRLQTGYAAERYESAAAEDDGASLRRFLAGAGDGALVESFLEGLPRQFLRSASRLSLAEYFQSYAEHVAGRPVAMHWSRSGGVWETMVITADRPHLFSRITGALAAFGMNIVRAQAFSNRRGVAFDLIAFEDPMDTLERNPSEQARLEATIGDVIAGRAAVADLLRRRSTSIVHRRPPRAVPVTIALETRGDRWTVLEIVAPDEIGLLHELARVISEQGVGIEVALVATEGRKAIDVFYLTVEGKPLAPDRVARLRAALGRLFAEDKSRPPSDPVFQESVAGDGSPEVN